MQFEIQKFAAVTIDDAAQASGKVAGDPVVTTYTIEEKDASYSVGVADGNYTVSGGSYIVTVANSEITAVQTIDGTTVEDWTTAISASSTIIVPGNAAGDEVTFTITAGAASGYVLNAGDDAVTGTTTVTVETSDDGTYVISLTDGKVTGVTHDGEAMSEEDYAELEVTQPGAVSTDTTTVETTSTSTVSYATFTLSSYSTATYAVTVDGNTITLTKDGEAVELTNNTFTETGTGETYTVNYSNGSLSVTSDQGNSVTNITESEAYLKASFVVGTATLSADYDPTGDHAAIASTVSLSGSGTVSYNADTGLYTITTTDEEGSTTATSYTVTFSSDASTAQLVPNGDSPAQIYDITSDTTVAVDNKATIGGFEITFDGEGKLTNVVYLKDTTLTPDEINADSGTFLFASVSDSEYTVSGGKETVTVGSGATSQSGTQIVGATLTSYMKNGDVEFKPESVTDVVTLSSDTTESELTSITLTNGTFAASDISIASAVLGSAAEVSVTGDTTFVFAGRTFTVNHDTDTNVTTLTVDKGAALYGDADGLTVQKARSAVAEMNYVTIDVDGDDAADYVLSVDTSSGVVNAVYTSTTITASGFAESSVAGAAAAGAFFLHLTQVRRMMYNDGERG